MNGYEPRRRMLRYEVGLDGPVAIGLTGDPVHVGTLGYGAGVEFWAEHDEAKPPRERAFQVFGTGHVLPEHATWVGTCDRTRDGLVWHLYEISYAGTVPAYGWPEIEGRL